MCWCKLVSRSGATRPGRQWRQSQGLIEAAGFTALQGLCDFALGSDTGGSVRVPASYCGVLGTLRVRARERDEDKEH
jgi:hypothetical protein